MTILLRNTQWEDRARAERSAEVKGSAIEGGEADVMSNVGGRDLFGGIVVCDRTFP